MAWARRRDSWHEAKSDEGGWARRGQEERRTTHGLSWPVDRGKKEGIEGDRVQSVYGEEIYVAPD